MMRAILVALAALGDAAPALAADRSPASLLPERIAFAIILVGSLAFFVWVAWLALRR